MKDTNSYYDFEIDAERLITDSGNVEEYFYLQDLKQRKLFLIRSIRYRLRYSPLAAGGYEKSTQKRSRRKCLFKGG